MTRAVVATRSCARAFHHCTGARPTAREDSAVPAVQQGQPGRRARRAVPRLAVPGAQDVQPADDLVAIWRTSEASGFRTTGPPSRSWMLRPFHAAGSTSSPPASRSGLVPEPYRDWVSAASTRRSSRRGRSSTEPRPSSRPRPPRTRRWSRRSTTTSPRPLRVRGLRDRALEHAGEGVGELRRHAAVRRRGPRAYGWYHLGPDTDRIRLEWSLEAKLYAPDNGAGVKETSRLISRLRHRELGVFVTTGYVGKQAYEEIRGDHSRSWLSAAATSSSYSNDTGTRHRQP